MSSQTFNISLPKQLVQEVDETAKKDYLNRSEFIRQVLRMYLDESLPCQPVKLTSEESVSWKKSFASVKPLTKKLSFAAQRRIAWEDKLYAAAGR